MPKRTEKSRFGDIEIAIIHQDYTQAVQWLSQWYDEAIERFMPEILRLVLSHKAYRVLQYLAKRYHHHANYDMIRFVLTSNYDAYELYNMVYDTYSLKYQAMTRLLNHAVTTSLEPKALKFRAKKRKIDF